jgi:hypothetical protein
MRWITRHLRSTLLMLLMAAFVVVPVADALACTVEPHASTVHVESAPDADGDRRQACRCLWPQPLPPLQPEPAGHTFAAFGAPLPARWMNAGDAATYAVAQDELTRPPRA